MSRGPECDDVTSKLLVNELEEEEEEEDKEEEEEEGQ